VGEGGEGETTRAADESVVVVVSAAAVVGLGVVSFFLFIFDK